MDTARRIQSGRSQAVRWPRDHRFRGSEVAVSQTLEDGLAAFEPGFVLERFKQSRMGEIVRAPDHLSL